MGQKTCSICSSPPEIARTIEHEVELKHSYKRVAARFGFSKSSVHRHVRNCTAKRVIIDHASRRCTPGPFEMRVSWPAIGDQPAAETHISPAEPAFGAPHAAEPPIIEISVIFEEAVAARPQQVEPSAIPVGEQNEIAATSATAEE